MSLTRRSGGGGSATPGGSDTEVQFNDSGAFGGDALFTWDKTLSRVHIGNAVLYPFGGGNNSFRIATPNELDFNPIGSGPGGVGAGPVIIRDSVSFGNLNTMDVVSGGVAIGDTFGIGYVAPDNSLIVQDNFGVGDNAYSPRGLFDANNSITVGNVASLAKSFVTGSGDFDRGNSFTITVDIYAYKTVGAGRVYSYIAARNTFTEDGVTGGPYYLNYTWPPVTDADGYRLVIVGNGDYTEAVGDQSFDVTAPTVTFDYGNGNEFSWDGDGTHSPNFVGGNLYLDSVSGATTSLGTASFSSYISTSPSEINTFSGPVSVSTSNYLPGRDTTMLIENPTGVASLLFRGVGNAKLEWRVTTAPTNAQIYQIYVNDSGEMSWGMVNDSENLETRFLLFTRSGITPSTAQFLGGIKVGIGVSPTAMLHLKAGTTSATTAPLKYSSGSLMSSAEAGASEFLTDLLYITKTTGATRCPILAAVNGRLTAKTAAQTSVVAFTPPSDGSFLITANVLVTTATLHSFTATVTYVDEGGTSRTVTLNFSTLAGAITPTIANAGGAVPYEGVPLHIRAKGTNAITIATTGTFTTVTYNVEGSIIQIS